MPAHTTHKHTHARTHTHVPAGRSHGFHGPGAGQPLAGVQVGGAAAHESVPGCGAPSASRLWAVQKQVMPRDVVQFNKLHDLNLCTLPALALNGFGHSGLCVMPQGFELFKSRSTVLFAA